MACLWTVILVWAVIVGRVQCECFLEDLEDSGIRVIKSRLEDEKAKRLLLQSDMDALMLKVEKLGQKIDAPQSGTSCPDRWVTYRGSCYKFGDIKMTFDSAIEYCQRIGGHVVQVDSPDKNHFLKDFVKSLQGSGQYYWIGLTDEAEEGKWTWYLSKERTLYTDWHGSEPNGGRGENCVIINSKEAGRAWIDVSCTSKYYSVCERN